MGALEFLCDIRFHQSFLLEPNLQTGRRKPFRVSYSDYGDRNSDAVVFFCGALMGTRLSYAPLDQLAKFYHVRMIHADRPGIGGTDPVEQHERIATWLGKHASCIALQIVGLTLRQRLSLNCWLISRYRMYRLQATAEVIFTFSTPY